MLLHAESVCIVGASPKQTTLGGQALERLVRHGFGGRVELVNPRYDEIEGRPCHPSVGALPAPTDVAMICIPSGGVPAVVRECGEAGIPVVLVIASGFQESAGSETLVTDLRSALDESGVRLVGPNTEGIWSIESGLFLTFGSASMMPRYQPGPVSIISQSGGIGTAVVRHLQGRGIGCRYFIGVGNAMDLTALDFLEFIVTEGAESIVGLYTEGLSDGHRLKGIMRQARERGIAVAALRAGVSEEGRAATASHTGRIATASRIYADIFRQTGVIEVATISELLLATETLATLRRPSDVSRSGGLGVISVSGGCSGVIADAASRHGVPLATFGPETLDALAGCLPSYASVANPVDPTGAVLQSPELLAQVMAIVGADEDVDLVLVQLGNSALSQAEGHFQQFCNFAPQSGKPLVISSIGDDLPAEQRRRFAGCGITWSPDPDEAIRRCGWLLEVSRWTS